MISTLVRLLARWFGTRRPGRPDCRTCGVEFTGVDAPYRTRTGQCCFCAQWEGSR